MDMEAVPCWEENGKPCTLHPGQLRAWESKARIVSVRAGSQGGKTKVGARLLVREIQRTAKHGEANDYLIVGPNVELMRKKAIPEFVKACEGMVEYKTNGRFFVFTPEGSRRLCGFECEIKVFLGYAQEPDSLVSATYKAIWADECGQATFGRDAWEEIYLRRAAVYSARLFLTSTPYTATGWYRDVCEGKYPDTELVAFVSADNPAFPAENIRLAKESLPDWKYRQFHLGEFVRPAGAIYDCFDRKRHVVEPFEVPDNWPRYVGIDFGQVNTFAVFLAEDPSSKGEDKDLYVFAEHRGSGEAESHVRAIYKTSPDIDLCCGGTWSGEDPEWRKDYIAAGLPVKRPPIKEVEVGIDRVYRQLKLGKLRFFSTCAETIRNVEDYSRELDDDNNPTLEIADKHSFHGGDSLRYIVSELRASSGDQRNSHFSRSGSPAQRPHRETDRELYERNTRLMEQEAEEDGVGFGFKTRRLV